MADPKQTNFRIDEKEAARFRKFCEQAGVTQAGGFSHLMSLLDLERASTSIPNRQTEIENFLSHTQALLSAYTQSLDINQSAEDRIRDKYKHTLQAQEKTIAEYKDKAKRYPELEKQLNAAHKTIAEMQSVIDQHSTLESARLKDKEQQLWDKDNLNALLKDKLARAEEKAKEYDAISDTLKQANQRIAELEQQLSISEKTHEVATLKLTAEYEQKLSSQQLSSERELHAAETKANAEIRQLEARIAELGQKLLSN